MALREAAYRKAAELEILGRLSGSMAHDFNNALLVIFAAVDQFSRADVPPELEPAVDAIRSAATQAASATRQLRAFGPHTSHSVANVNLAPAVRRLAALLERVVPSNIEIELDVDDDVGILADEAQIQRMLTNLVLNARDAMRDGGRVILRVKRAATESGAFALLEVEDNGGGMSEDVVQRLFEPFFTTKGGAGTGLGLASVRQLVEGAGGQVNVRSRLGVGTTLSVHWPLAEVGVGAAPSTQSAAVSGAGINVLVVDDDAQVRSLLVRGLRRYGFFVLEAGDGREGLLMARRHREPIHALCADCIMPGIPLRELVAGFRESHPRASVVVCSGHAAEEVGFDADMADQFLGKPFQVKELASCIYDLRQRAPDSAAFIAQAPAEVA
jgi:two-component system, cell cycle sensor histidine kinase and response regulator CckA